jgi:cell division transport system permease protein
VSFPFSSSPTWSIRIPYILEGAIAGFFGGFLAWLIIYLIYSKLFGMFMATTNPTDIMAMITPATISPQILWLNLSLGIGVGAIGSAVSVRNYIKV